VQTGRGGEGGMKVGGGVKMMERLIAWCVSVCVCV